MSSAKPVKWLLAFLGRVPSLRLHSSFKSELALISILVLGLCSSWWTNSIQTEFAQPRSLPLLASTTTSSSQNKLEPGSWSTCQLLPALPTSWQQYTSSSLPPSRPCCSLHRQPSRCALVLSSLPHCRLASCTHPKQWTVLQPVDVFVLLLGWLHHDPPSRAEHLPALLAYVHPDADLQLLSRHARAAPCVRAAPPLATVDTPTPPLSSVASSVSHIDLPRLSEAQTPTEPPSSPARDEAVRGRQLDEPCEGKQAPACMGAPCSPSDVAMLGSSTGAFKPRKERVVLHQGEGPLAAASHMWHVQALWRCRAQLCSEVGMCHNGCALFRSS